MKKRGISKITALAASLAMAAATVVVGSTPAAADQFDPPTNLRVTDLSANHVTVAWDPPEGAVDYIAEIYQAPDLDTRIRSFRLDEPSATLFLEQGTTYQLRVQTAYNAGRMPSEWTDRIEFTMTVDEANPSVPPPGNIDVNVEPSSIGVTVEWDPPVSEASGLFYSVLFTRGYQRESAGTSELTLTRYLRPGTTYEVQVQARDAAGRRTFYSAPVEFTTPDESPVSTPENVQAITEPGGVTVTWDPSFSEAGVEQYRVTLRGASGGTFATRLIPGTTATFEHPPGGNFSVSVTAGDSANRWSGPTDPVAFTMPPAEDWEPPSAPTNFRATAVDSRVLLEWDEPAQGLGPFTYHISSDGRRVESVVDELELLAEYIVECQPGQTPGDVTVTATSFGVESPPSNAITLCSF